MERGKQCSINQPHLGKYRSILSCHPILKYLTIEFGTLSVRTERQQLYDQLQIIKPRPDFVEHPALRNNSPANTRALLFVIYEAKCKVLV